MEDICLRSILLQNCSWSIAICNHHGPELAYFVNKFSQFMLAPIEVHWKAVKQILRYLNGFPKFNLHLRRNTDLNWTAFCDVGWASDPDDRRSTSGMCVYLGSNLITWQSKKQQTISRSSTKAEYRSLACVVAELSWLKSYTFELRVKQSHASIV